MPFFIRRVGDAVRSSPEPVREICGADSIAGNICRLIRISCSDNSLAGPDLVHITELVQQYYDVVYRLTYLLAGTSHDAEDLTQQAFLDAQRKLDTLRDPDSAKAWLCMIARNLYRRKLRDAKPTSASLDVAPEPAAEAPRDSVDRNNLQRALSSLSDEFRSVLVLFYFENMNYQQIATELNVPVGTVMSRLSRGKQVLRQRLNPDDF